MNKCTIYATGIAKQHFFLYSGTQNNPDCTGMYYIYTWYISGIDYKPALVY